MSSHPVICATGEAKVAAVVSSSAPAALRHVRQRTPRDCGVAAAAMLADVSYDRAAMAHPPERPGGGLQAMDVAIMLRRLTGKLVRLSGAAEGRTLGDYAATAVGPAVVLIHEPESLRGHYVAVSGAEVLDPELPAPMPLGSYRHREWLVFRVLTLEDEPVHATAA